MRNFIAKLTLILLFQAGTSFAATGDILKTDLHATSAAGASGTRTVQTSGCAPGGTGVCIKMDCTTGLCTGNDAWILDIPDTREVTIVWWERYDTWPLANGNCKSIRPYNGDSSTDYIAAYISAYFSTGNYMSTFERAIVTPSPITTITNTTNPGNWDPSCTDLGNGKYDCGNYGRMKFSWSTNGGASQGMGTNWRKMRMHIKMPLTYTSGDGEITMWVDDKLIFTAVNVDMKPSGSAYTTRVMFAPVDESTTPHGHWYDEITIYEGYVSPDNKTPGVTPPANLKVISVAS